MEDFAQLGGRNRETKYRASMEQVAGLLDAYCTFPTVEKVKLLRLALFSFLVGNEDMHLKNFSVIRNGDVVALSPAYDLLNTTIVFARPEEELALPLNGKKHNLTRKDFLEYFARERLGLTDRVVDKILSGFIQARPRWEELIGMSFLSETMQKKYLQVLDTRFARIFGIRCHGIRCQA